jgi:hypothetical protein
MPTGGGASLFPYTLQTFVLKSAKWLAFKVKKFLKIAMA